MDYVYVVTYSQHGSEDGQFHKEEAHVRIEDAETAAAERMDLLRAYGAFTLVSTKNSAQRHIVKRWDSHGKFGMTVWLERLEVQE